MTDRKLDHINLAFQSQTAAGLKDKRFVYEPMLNSHPTGDAWPAFKFLNKQMRIPLWVSSMTGGTELAGKINQNIARVAREFGMGMGLGSCRILLDDNTHFPDFDVRKYLGDDLPLYANLGIAQVETMLANNQVDKIQSLLDSLQADGLIVHINPMQEWFQPEGNRIQKPPIETIERLLSKIDFPLVVKEVGQGMGRKSLQKLLHLPLQAVELAAFGGTNFSMVELQRNTEAFRQTYSSLANIGQTAEEMVDDINSIVSRSDVQCKEIIVSGGVKNFLDGYYLMEKCQLNAVMGQASMVLKYAKESYEALHEYISAQVEGLRIARQFLRINKQTHD